MDCDPTDLNLQIEEVSEAVWMSAQEILEDIMSNDSEICTNKAEITKAINILSRK